MSLSVPRYVTAILLTIAVAFITIGGIKRIASVAEKVIPFMCVLYIGGVILILVSHITVLPSTIALIIKSAFTPQAVFGGGTGITMVIAMQKELVVVFSQMRVVLEAHQLRLLLLKQILVLNKDLFQ